MTSQITDFATQRKWDKAAPNFDLMAGRGAEKRWAPFKRELYANMQGEILFLALGTGLDIAMFPPGKTITAIDISPQMLKIAAPRAEAYQGELRPYLMDVHDMDFPDNHFDQVFTSCTFCSVPNPVAGLEQLERVLKPGGDIYMFEHTGSRLYPIRPMMQLMSLLTQRVGPSMSRETVENVRKAGFQLLEVNNLFLDVVKTIHARKFAGEES
jgi:ubiquinone/menaquinone biosynthesis C-methylase UbiE